jgi:hypothetical protein
MSTSASELRNPAWIRTPIPHDPGASMADRLASWKGVFEERMVLAQRASVGRQRFDRPPSTLYFLPDGSRLMLHYPHAISVPADIGAFAVVRGCALRSPLYAQGFDLHAYDWLYCRREVDRLYTQDANRVAYVWRAPL